MLNSPWELILTEPVEEVVEFHSADWAEKLAQSARSSSQVTLSPSYTGRLSWRVSEKKYLTKSRKSQALTCGLGINTLHQFSLGIYQKYIVNFYRRCRGHATISTGRGNNRLVTLHSPFSYSCYRAKPKWSSTIDMSGDTPPLICTRLNSSYL